jgi:hypothetical protein
MDTADDVIVRFINHDRHYPQGKGSQNSSDSESRTDSRWRFASEAEFSDGSTKWMQGSQNSSDSESRTDSRWRFASEVRSGQVYYSAKV